jgi:hypothetical protein
MVVPTYPEGGSHALQVCQHHHQVVRVGHFVGLSETGRTWCSRLLRPIRLKPSRYNSAQRALLYREGGGRWPVRPRECAVFSSAHENRDGVKFTEFNQTPKRPRTPSGSAVPRPGPPSPVRVRRRPASGSAVVPRPVRRSVWQTPRQTGRAGRGRPRPRATNERGAITVDSNTRFRPRHLSAYATLVLSAYLERWRILRRLRCRRRVRFFLQG